MDWINHKEEPKKFNHNQMENNQNKKNQNKLKQNNDAKSIALFHIKLCESLRALAILLHMW